MQKNKQLKEDEILFEVIEDEKTCIKVEFKTSANFVERKLHFKLQERETPKKKKKFVKQSKYKNCGCKHLTDQKCKNINKKYNKYYKKGISFIFITVILF